MNSKYRKSNNIKHKVKIKIKDPIFIANLTASLTRANLTMRQACRLEYGNDATLEVTPSANELPH